MTTIELLNISFTWYGVLFVCDENTLDLLSKQNFKHTLLLTTVAMLYMMSPETCHLITESLYCLMCPSPMSPITSLTSPLATNSLYLSVSVFVCFFFKHLFVFETERDRARAGEGQRERKTQNPKQAPGSELSAQSPTWGSNSQTARSWPQPELKPKLSWLSRPGAPHPHGFFLNSTFVIFRSQVIYNYIS